MRINLFGHKPAIWAMVVFASAQLTTSAAERKTAQSGSVSLTQPIRGKWQQHMTLGPGDVLNLSLLENPDSMRNEVPVGPDGRITFLQAHDIQATGLTIDELKARLNQE